MFLISLNDLDYYKISKNLYYCFYILDSSLKIGKVVYDKYLAPLGLLLKDNNVLLYDYITDLCILDVKYYSFESPSKCKLLLGKNVKQINRGNFYVKDYLINVPYINSKLEIKLLTIEKCYLDSMDYNNLVRINDKWYHYYLSYLDVYLILELSSSKIISMFSCSSSDLLYFDESGIIIGDCKVRANFILLFDSLGNN